MSGELFELNSAPAPVAPAPPSRLRRLLHTARLDAGRLLHTGVPHLFAALLGTQGIVYIQRILLARILTEAEIGQITLVMSILPVIMVLGDIGIGTSVLKFASEPVSEQARRRLYCAGLCLGTLSGVLAGVLFMAVVWVWDFGPERELRVFMLMAAPYIPLLVLANMPMLFMQARKEIKRAARLTVLTQTLSLGLILAATALFRLHGYFAVISIAPLGNLLILLFATRAHLAWLPPTLALARKLFAFGGYSMLANFTGYVTLAAPPVLMKHLGLPYSELGLYGVALMFANGARLMPDALLRVAFPYLSGLIHEPARVRARQRELSRKQCLLMAALLAGWLLLGPGAIWLTVGPRYLASFWISVTLIAGLVPFAFSSPYSYVLIILNAVRLNVGMSVLALTFNAAACLLLIPRLGALGAAIAVSVAQLAASGTTVLVGEAVLRRRIAAAARAGGTGRPEPGEPT